MAEKNAMSTLIEITKGFVLPIIFVVCGVMWTEIKQTQAELDDFRKDAATIVMVNQVRADMKEYLDNRMTGVETRLDSMSAQQQKIIDYLIRMDDRRTQR